MDSSSDKDLDDIIITSGLYLLKLLKRRKKRHQRMRRFYVNPYLMKRHTKGRFVVDFNDMRSAIAVFKENFHVTPKEFDEIFSKLEPLLQAKKKTRPNDAISPKEKFIIVLEYLASGSMQRHMASIYRISKQHMGVILDEVCSAICECFKMEELSPQRLLTIANEFNSQWNFPNCVGAIDGKHVAIRCPKNAGSLFYNYKGFHSIVLMAAVDAKYKFTCLDIGAYGSEGDSGVFSNSRFGREILNDTMPFPANLPVGNATLPFFFVGDDAFPLHHRIIKPYAPKKPTKLTEEERIFNYRLSRARRCVENAFGIVCSKWLCLGRTMFCGPDRAQKIVSSCCLLHNYLIDQKSSSYCPPHLVDRYTDNGEIIEGSWRQNLPNGSVFNNNLATCRSGRPNSYAKNVRDNLKRYVNSTAGSLCWQRRAVFLEK